MAVLYIIRGIPGSGKSTLAKSLVKSGLAKAHYEADMFFINENGEYSFDPKKIKDAHEWCQNSVKDSLISGLNVVVSNTFTKRWEYQPYIYIAIRYQCEFMVIDCYGQFKNIHGVPDEHLLNMKKRWEPFIFN